MIIDVGSKEELVVLGRTLARELTPEELGQVAGGASGGVGNSYSGIATPDDHCPTDEF